MAAASPVETAAAAAPVAADRGLAALGIDRDARLELQAQAETIATRLRLPLRAARGGLAGQMIGAGIGVSLEFQDHRPYYPGDDPRHLNWAAYARTGQYTMKMYREEITPRLDLVLDCSPSMFLTPAKARRTLGLLAFVQASAQRVGALLRAYQANSTTALELPLTSLRAHTWEPLPSVERLGAPAVGRVPWRAQSLRVVVTDLLYAVPPEDVLGPLLQTTGRAILLCPWSRAEAEPDWDGQIELRECESGEKRLFQASPARLENYRANYRRHFALWDEACRARGVALARISEEGALLDALLQFALPAGAVELTQS
jgi:uncharacterized protein (DUF58 family)